MNFSLIRFVILVSDWKLNLAVLKISINIVVTTYKNMKYFEIKNNNWVEAEYNPNRNHIILYEKINGVITPIGIGQY